jgi:hypothetical protein
VLTALVGFEVGVQLPPAAALQQSAAAAAQAPAEPGIKAAAARLLRRVTSSRRQQRPPMLELPMPSESGSEAHTPMFGSGPRSGASSAGARQLPVTVSQRTLGGALTVSRRRLGGASGASAVSALQAAYAAPEALRSPRGTPRPAPMSPRLLSHASPRVLASSLAQRQLWRTVHLMSDPGTVRGLGGHLLPRPAPGAAGAADADADAEAAAAIAAFEAAEAAPSLSGGLSAAAPAAQEASPAGHR